MIIHKCFGLDLGTTNSTSAIISNGEVIYGVERITKSKVIPSIVAVTRDGKEVVGSVARGEFYSGNINSKKSIKREMGKDIKFEINNKELTPEEISSKIISYCKNCLEATVGKKNNIIYDKVIITVPAYFNLSQKDATRKAAELCGLEVKMLLEEPSAAAINFSLKNNVENGVFFVFDLGGGTFDISILEKTGNIPQVLATAGNNFLGGDNFDFLVARYFLEVLKKNGIDVEDVKVDVFNPSSKFKLLLSVAERCKRNLSTQEEVSINEQNIFKDGSGRDLIIHSFTRRDFNSLIKEKVETDILNECSKALTILENKHGKTIEDITHILLVGGSSKIPYIQDIIRNKYCVTNALKDIICFEPEFSVSAGAAFVANSFGYSIEDEQNNVIIDLNAPFIVEGQVYISGFDTSVKLNKIGLIVNGKEEVVSINEDNSFMFIINEDEYTEKLIFNFYINDIKVNNVVSDSNSTIDIIAPTPVQNETIAIEIIDIEKGQTEQYPIVESGVSLPSETIEYFKINEYSNKQVILPVWEGPRKIFQLVIDLPSGARIGSKLKVKTSVDSVSNISLDVELDGEKVLGRYEYTENTVNRKEEVDKIREVFDERINYLNDDNQKSDYLDKRDNIERELKEANENNDATHYESVSQKYEKLAAELPKEIILKEEDFDILGESIKEKINEDSNVTKEDVDNLVFYGKRFIKKGNQKEAKHCMDELRQLKSSVELFASPKQFLNLVKYYVVHLLSNAHKYITSPFSDQYYVTKLKEEIENKQEIIVDLLEKYDENDYECEEMRETAIQLLQNTVSIKEILETIIPDSDENKTISDAFNGLVSKA